MQALLLAGGLGTRLRSVVDDRPKPMAPVGDKPFLYYLVEQLKKNGITDVIFAVGYKGSMIEEYFGDGKEFGIKISYSYEKEQLGTAGAIKNAVKYINQEYFLVLNADTFYNLEYGSLLDIREQEDSKMVLVLREIEESSRYGVVTLNGSRITGFNEKVQGSGKALINGGVYLMDKSLLDEIPESKCSLENEMIPLWLNKGYKLSAYINDGYFIDIGIPEDYFRFRKDAAEFGWR
ncbi:MAG: NTP transferase domain-containing protein [Lachnospiraceae bacterium]|nr:NTP transferase domain-containing protein [Lachnospiraceae bacterium]